MELGDETVLAQAAQTRVSLSAVCVVRLVGAVHDQGRRDARPARYSTIRCKKIRHRLIHVSTQAALQHR